MGEAQEGLQGLAPNGPAKSGEDTNSLPILQQLFPSRVHAQEHVEVLTSAKQQITGVVAGH